MNSNAYARPGASCSGGGGLCQADRNLRRAGIDAIERHRANLATLEERSLEAGARSGDGAAGWLGAGST